MGLDDIYYKRAYAPAQDANAQTAQGFEQLAQVPIANAQLAAQQQANTDAAYTAPGAQAPPERNIIGHHIKARMAGPPEFQQRFLQEMSQGPAPAQGLAPQVQPQAPVDAPRGDAGDMRPQGYRPQPAQAQGLGAPAPTNANPQMETYVSPMNGRTPLPAGVRTPLPASSSFAADRNPPAPQTPRVAVAQGQPSGRPMSNYEVDSYMRMSPFLKLDQVKDDPRRDIAANKLAENSRQFDELMRYKRDNMGMREKLARMMNETKLKIGDPDRKAKIALMKDATARYLGELRAEATALGGFTALTQRDEVGTFIQERKAKIAEALAEAQDFERQLAEMEGMTPGKTQTQSSGQGSMSYSHRESGVTKAKKGPTSGTIKVKLKSTGEPGVIPASEWDPKLYERR